MPELTQTVSPLGGGVSTTTGGSAGGAAARPVITQTFSRGNGEHASAKAENTPVIEQSVPSGGASRGGSMLSESTRQMLSNLDKYGSVLKPKDAPDEPAKTDSPPAASGADAAGATAQPASPPASPEASPATPKPDAATAAPSDEHKQRADRYEAKNRELVAEVERLRAAPKSAELDKRLKALDAAERMYLDDPIGAVRHLIATVHGYDDPKHTDVDAELSGLYQDLTARELGVPLDAAKRAERESARTRQIVARERRERELAAQKPAVQEDPEAQLFADHSAFIANHIQGRDKDGRAVADAYPLAMKFSERMHGHKPEALALKIIREAVATGEIPMEMSAADKIRHAFTKIETHYQDLAKSFDEARPRNSTAAPTPPADAKANQDTGRTQVAPTITNASASVAPATPPAKQDTKPVDQDFRRRRPGESEDARRKRIAEHHMGR